MIPGVWVWQLEGMLDTRCRFWSFGAMVFWYCGAPTLKEAILGTQNIDIWVAVAPKKCS